MGSSDSSDDNNNIGFLAMEKKSSTMPLSLVCGDKQRPTTCKKILEENLQEDEFTIVDEMDLFGDLFKPAAEFAEIQQLFDEKKYDDRKSSVGEIHRQNELFKDLFGGMDKDESRDD